MNEDNDCNFKENYQTFYKFNKRPRINTFKNSTEQKCKRQYEQ